MEELLNGEAHHQADNIEFFPPYSTSAGQSQTKLGWIEGVLLNVLLAIWGVMMFLRLSWVIGQAGLVQGILIITLCNVVTGVTALSMSAVSTNGQIASGGVYYMISRALGPEFGGAIGIMFTLANAISVATYILGFCGNLFDLLYEVTDFSGIVSSDRDRLNDLRILGSAVLVFLVVIAVVGISWVTRVQKVLLVLLLLAQIDIFCGSFLTGGTGYIDADTRQARGFTGWSLVTGQKNLNSHYLTNSKGHQETFISVFGVFFTAVTGITAGANLSGDLKNPSHAIPKGTLSAIVLTYLTYVLAAIIVGFNFLPEVSGNIEELIEASGKLPSLENCTEAANVLRQQLNLTETTCSFGSAIDQKVMIYLSGTGFLVYFGCFGATLSSAIASLVGAPRILQAVSKDNLYPKLGFFAKGSGPGNDPIRGYFLVALIAFGCLMIGDLNTIGALASNFFLAAYALMNLSVFHSSMTASPGWRPSFTWYNPWGSLLGAVVCLVLMFAMDWILACATMAVMSFLYCLILYLKPAVNWGSSKDALVFLNAVRNVYTLENQVDHAKTYRPKILLLSGNPAHRQPLVHFANLITQKMSLLVCAQIVKDSNFYDLASLTDNVKAWLRDHKIQSFFTVSEGRSFSEGVKNAIMLTGMGKLSPNMVLLGFNSHKDNLDSIVQYHEVLVICLEKHMGIGILCLQNGTDFSAAVGEEAVIEEDVINPAVIDGLDRKISKEKVRKVSRKISHFKDKAGQPLPKYIVDKIQSFNRGTKEGHIDVWWLYDDGGLTLLLPYILHSRKQFAECKLRVYSLADKVKDYEKTTINLARLLAKFRIEFSELFIIPDITKKAKKETKVNMYVTRPKIYVTIKNAAV